MRKTLLGFKFSWGTAGEMFWGHHLFPRRYHMLETWMELYSNLWQNLQKSMERLGCTVSPCWQYNTAAELLWMLCQLVLPYLNKLFETLYIIKLYFHFSTLLSCTNLLCFRFSVKYTNLLCTVRSRKQEYNITAFLSVTYLLLSSDRHLYCCIKYLLSMGIKSIED